MISLTKILNEIAADERIGGEYIVIKNPHKHSHLHSHSQSQSHCTLQINDAKKIINAGLYKLVIRLEGRIIHLYQECTLHNTSAYSSYIKKNDVWQRQYSTDNRILEVTYDIFGIKNDITDFEIENEPIMATIDVITSNN